VAIGAGIIKVQSVFGELFNAADVARDGSQFGRLVRDGERLTLGQIEIESCIRLVTRPPA
jgi:hypothetical protein